MTTRILLSTLGASLDQHVVLPAVGTRGGVLVAWNSSMCRAITQRVDSYSVSILFQNSHGEQWWYTGVYGPQEEAQKLLFLDELRVIHAACIGPLLIAGDFNLIYRSADKNNTNINRAMMGWFRRALNDLELKEIDLLGRKYTWSNERAAPMLVRLDRAFWSSSWEAIFPNHLLQSTVAGISDHCPLVLNLHSNGPGKRRFHFESYWPQLEGFTEAVTQAWNSTTIDAQACPAERLACKLLSTSRALQPWSQKKVGNVAAQLHQARELLQRFEIAQELQLLTPEELWLRR